ncbi:hypothetical protein [Flavonifractor sp.]|uniref:hypothetical protein n=1 Tax=Flavonifractor sp. TaxID=2049025 RepID=UPI00307BE584
MDFQGISDCDERTQRNIVVSAFDGLNRGLPMLLCKQAAKIFQTICKKETALKRVLRNLLSAVSFTQI